MSLLGSRLDLRAWGLLLVKETPSALNRGSFMIGPIMKSYDPNYKDPH